MSAKGGKPVSDLDYYYPDDADERLRALEKRLDKLERSQAELAAINRRLNAAAEKFVKASRSSLWNPNIIVRSFYIYGHSMLAAILIGLVLSICYVVVFIVPAFLRAAGVFGG